MNCERCNKKIGVERYIKAKLVCDKCFNKIKYDWENSTWWTKWRRGVRKNTN